MTKNQIFILLGIQYKNKSITDLKQNLLIYQVTKTYLCQNIII